MYPTEKLLFGSLLYALCVLSRRSKDRHVFRTSPLPRAAFVVPMSEPLPNATLSASFSTMITQRKCCIALRQQEDANSHYVFDLRKGPERQNCINSYRLRQCHGLAAKYLQSMSSGIKPLLKIKSSLLTTLTDLHFHLLTPREYLNLQLISSQMFRLNFVINNIQATISTF